MSTSRNLFSYIMQLENCIYSLQQRKDFFFKKKVKQIETNQSINQTKITINFQVGILSTYNKGTDL